MGVNTTIRVNKVNCNCTGLNTTNQLLDRPTCQCSNITVGKVVVGMNCSCCVPPPPKPVVIPCQNNQSCNCTTLPNGKLNCTTCVGVQSGIVTREQTISNSTCNCTKVTQSTKSWLNCSCCVEVPKSNNT